MEAVLRSERMMLPKPSVFTAPSCTVHEVLPPLESVTVNWKFSGPAMKPVTVGVAVPPFDH